MVAAYQTLSNGEAAWGTLPGLGGAPDEHPGYLKYSSDDHGVPPNILNTFPHKEAATWYVQLGGRTALYEAATEGKAACVRVLLDHAAFTPAAAAAATTEEGWTPLMRAARWGHAEQAAHALERGLHLPGRLGQGADLPHRETWNHVG